ncbi:MAG: hypothetical protein RI963_2849 [Planctomycetota bacterium]
MRGGSQFFDLSTGAPYNPSSPLFAGDDFVLTSPDGTVYTIDAAQGITSITNAAGKTVYVGDSAIIAPGGEAIRFITGADGRIAGLVGPQGEVIRYAYDEQGRLTAMREPATGRSSRYGYEETANGRLTLAIDQSGTGSAFRYQAAAPPVTYPVARWLGAAANFSGVINETTVAKGDAVRFAISARQSEVEATGTGELLLRVIARTRDGLKTQVPSIPGLTPRSTFLSDDRSEAIFAIRSEGMFEIEVASRDGSGGMLALSVAIVGDVNADGRVDGILASDLDGSGTIDIQDRFLLFRNGGFIANAAPIANTELSTQLAHVDLAMRFPLDKAVEDPDGDAVYYRIVGVDKGAASISPDGKMITFKPAAGYAGAAGIVIVADDGFNTSAPVRVDINVSASALLTIDILNRKPDLAVGEREGLMVVGHFTDQKDVPLLEDYVSYTVTGNGVITVDANGMITAVAEGFSAVIARRGDVAAATAVVVGEPFDELRRDQELFVYPGALTLPRTNGRRQFIVRAGRDGQDLLASGDAVLVVADARVLEMNGEGRATSKTLGTTTVTIISGGGEETVEVRVVEPQVGSAEFGEAGGVLQAQDGTQVQIPPGVLPEGTPVSVTPWLLTPDIKLPSSDVLRVGQSFQLDFGGEELTEPAQLAVPVNSSFAPGDTVYFLKKEWMIDATGTRRDYWLVMENGIVGDDGFARTSSPPYPGFSAGGQYLLAKSDQPEKLLTIGGAAPSSTEGFSLMLDFTIGLGVGLGFGLLPMWAPVLTIATYRSNPKELPVVEQRVSVAGAIPGQVFLPEIALPFINPRDSKPVITGLELTSLDPPTIKVTGSRFSGARLFFRYQGTDHLLQRSGSDTEITGTIPKGMISGLGDIVVKHPKFGISNIARLSSQGRLGAIATTGGGVAVIDTRSTKNEIVKEFNTGGGSDTIFTTDATRLYVGTFRNGIGVIDTITLQQLPPIPLPNNAFHHQVTIDPGNRFLFVGGPENVIYVVDIRPESPSFHKTLTTINLPRTRPNPSTGIAVTADGSKLLVGTGYRENNSDEGFLTVYELDWSKAPTANNPSTVAFAKLMADHRLPGLPQSVNATNDPTKATVTYRYQPTVYTPNYSGILRNKFTFGAIDLAGGKTIKVKNVRTDIPGGLDPISQGYSYSGYYLDTYTPRDVVVTPDLRAAFVADWNFFSVGLFGGQRGDKIGVVLDPFGIPEYLGATTPVDFGCPTNVALDVTGEILYATYFCIGETLAMSVDGLIETGLSRTEFQRERIPLDLLDFGLWKEPEPNPAIHITPITAGLPQGVSTQGGEFFSLRSFGSGKKLDEITLEYQIFKPQYRKIGLPIEVSLRAIHQLAGQPPIELGKITISPETIGKNGLLGLVDEEPGLALNGGVHKLRLDPKAIPGLVQRLQDRNIELIQAQVEQRYARFNRTLDFAGYYQDSPGGIGVLRTGSGSDDLVAIGPNADMRWSSGGKRPSESKTFAKPSEILIVTADANDKIETDGTPDKKIATRLVVMAGIGMDRVIGGAGDDYLHAGLEDDSDPISFNVLMGMGGNDELQGSKSKDVLIGDGIVLEEKLFDTFFSNMAQGIFAMPNLIVPYGNGMDLLKGDDGFDVLIGGEGKDRLYGEGGANFLIGDTFHARQAGRVELKRLFDTSAKGSFMDRLTAEAQQLQKFFDNIGFHGAGGDQYVGQGAIDFFLAGDGDDTIDMTESIFTIGSGGLGRDKITGAAGMSLIWGDQAVTLSENSSRENAGNRDEITAVPGSGLNVFFGDYGPDKITGGGRLDFLFGDSLGVGIKWTVELAKSFAEQKIEADGTAMIATIGSGNDEIDGGLDVAIGADMIVGGDGNDNLKGSGLIITSGFEFGKASLSLLEVFSRVKNRNAKTTPDDEKEVKKLGKLFKFGLGFEIESKPDEVDTVLGQGILSVILGGYGIDRINTESFYTYIDADEGNDIINSQGSRAAWIEGGRGDDIINGPTAWAAFGSVIFGDAFKAVNPLKPIDLLKEAAFNFEAEWGKKIKANLGIALFQMTEEGVDTIDTGTGLINIVLGGASNDTIRARGKANLMVGDEFNVSSNGLIEYNFVTKTFNADLNGPGLNGNGDDTIYGTKNSVDIVFGGGGNDKVFGYHPDEKAGVVDIDVLFGNDGADNLYGGARLNLLVGGDGNDNLFGGDTLNVMIGDDYSLLTGNPLNDLASLKSRKLITGSGFVPVGSGNDVIIGGRGTDFIIGGDKRDVILAGDGFNLVYGDEINLGIGEAIDISKSYSNASDARVPMNPGLTGLGDDTILGGSGVDIFVGGAGKDDLRGYGGIDLLIGNDGDDNLGGGDGNDILIGGDGDDWLDGGADTDVMQGGKGRNFFVFSNRGKEVDSTFNPASWFSDFYTWKDNPDDAADKNFDMSGSPNNPLNQPPRLGFLRFDPTPNAQANESWTDFVGPVVPAVPFGPLRTPRDLAKRATDLVHVDRLGSAGTLARSPSGDLRRDGREHRFHDDRSPRRCPGSRVSPRGWAIFDPDRSERHRRQLVRRPDTNGRFRIRPRRQPRDGRHAVNPRGRPRRLADGAAARARSRLWPPGSRWHRAPDQPDGRNAGHRLATRPDPRRFGLDPRDTVVRRLRDRRNFPDPSRRTDLCGQR